MSDPLNLVGPAPDALLPLLVFMAGAWQIGTWVARAYLGATP